MATSWTLGICLAQVCYLGELRGGLLDATSFSYLVYYVPLHMSLIVVRENVFAKCVIVSCVVSQASWGSEHGLIDFESFAVWYPPEYCVTHYTFLAERLHATSELYFPIEQ